MRYCGIGNRAGLYLLRSLQELTVRQEMGDVKGECRAHGNLGAVHMCLGNYTNAIKCYQEQLERAKELRDCLMQAQAFGNLGWCIGHLFFVRSSMKESF